MKAADYGLHTPTVSAFVSTNSICQGQQVPILWPLIFKTGHQIAFAHTSFKWANLASHNAGVTVAIVGISNDAGPVRKLFTLADDGGSVVKEADNINAYLVAAPNVVVDKRSKPNAGCGIIEAGGKPVEGGNLLFGALEARRIVESDQRAKKFLKRAYGASEYIRGDVRYCIWVSDDDMPEAEEIADFAQRFEAVAAARNKSPKAATKLGAKWPHKFEEVKQTGAERVIIIPKVSSETREFLPVGLLPPGSIVTDLAFALYDAPLWNMALIASRLHLVWVATVCGKMKTDFRYSNTMGWNTFPVPKLTEKNRSDLTAAAEGILWPARRISPPPSLTSTTPKKCPPTCVPRMTTTTRFWNASTSAAASATTPNGWKNCSRCTRR